MAELIAFCPQIDNLFQGVDYDLALSANSNHESQITDLPVDDPKKSFINDMNRDKPVVLNMQLRVGVIGIPNFKEGDKTRLTKLYESLLTIKREQVDNPERLLDINTGEFVHKNMAISNISPFRNTSNSSQSLYIDLTFKEIRFAKVPVRIKPSIIGLNSGSGAINGENVRVASEEDRQVLESTNESSNKKTDQGTEEDESILYDILN